MSQYPGTVQQASYSAATIVLADGNSLPLQLDVNGNLKVTGINAILPLPTGASTSANQTNGNQVTQVSNFPAVQTVSVNNYPATQNVSQTSSGMFVSTVSTVTQVNSSTSNVSLLATNTSRKGAVLYNNSSSLCYIKLGTTSSSSNFTIAMQPLSTFIIDANPIWLGEIDAIWVTANGSMQITELT